MDRSELPGSRHCVGCDGLTFRNREDGLCPRCAFEAEHLIEQIELDGLDRDLALMSRFDAYCHERDTERAAAESIEAVVEIVSATEHKSALSRLRALPALPTLVSGVRCELPQYSPPAPKLFRFRETQALDSRPLPLEGESPWSRRSA